MSKFVLVNPPTMENAYHSLADFVAIPPSIGLAAIAAALERAGHEAVIYEGDAEGYTLQTMVDRVVADKPDYVGSTTMTATMDITYRFYEALKQRLPDVTVMVGGPHVSAVPEMTLDECDAIDIVVVGEADQTVVELLAAMDNGGDVSSVPGIAYRKDGKATPTAPREPIGDLGELSLPAHHLLRYDLYRSYGWNTWVGGYRGPLGVVFTGRGCYGRCNFCATHCVFGRGIRYFPLELVTEEIDLLVREYDIRVLYFLDDTFTAHRRRVNDICDFLIDRGYNRRLEIMVSARVDAVHLPTLEKMREAGIRWICFGVESGNEAILERMGKKVSIEQIRKAFRLSREAGLFIAGNYMFGHLGETWETAMDTINLACELPQEYASFAIAIPLPGTGLYQHCVDNGIKLPDWNGFGSVNTPPIPLNDSLNVEQLMELRRIATSRFFKRRSYLLGLLKKFRTRAVIADFARMYFALRKEQKAKRF